MSDYVNYDETLQVIVDSQPEVDSRYKAIGDAAVTNCDINQVMSNVTNATVVRNHGGSVIGYDYRYTHPTSPDTAVINIDSNSDSGSFGTATGGGGASGGGGAGRFNSGSFAGSVISDPDDPDKLESPGLVSSIISPSWAIVSTLSKFGKNVANESVDFIKSTAQSFASNFSDFLVDTADAATSGIRALFGVDSNTGETSMYLDEDTIGALAIQERDDDFLEDTRVVPPETQTTMVITSKIDYMDFYNFLKSQIVTPYYFYDNNTESNFLSAVNSIVERFPNGVVIGSIVYEATGSFASGSALCLGITDTAYAVGSTITERTVNAHWVSLYGAYINGRIRFGNSMTTPASGWQIHLGDYRNTASAMHILNSAGVNYEAIPAVPGVMPQHNSTSIVDAVTGADPHVVAQNLYSQFPSVMGSPTQIIVMDDSCNETVVNYYRIPISYSPTNLNISVPLTGTTQASPSFNPSVTIDPSINLDNYVSQIIKVLSGSGAGESTTTEPVDPSDPDAPSDTIDSSGISPIIPNIGVGETPISTLPATVPTALWHVYNPSTSEISAFGNWLWTVFDITSWKRLFQSPMDAVIGVHAIYGAPSVSSSAPIVCGDISSPVSALVVNSQYTSVSCGSVWLTEYFGNVYDYPPYTTVSIFLPFIGIVDLDVSDVMRSKLTVNYNIDVFTGACNCQISVERDAAGGVLYQYSGNCAVNYPISGASYNNILSSMIGISSSIAHIAANSHPATAAASLAFSAASALTPTINRSGSFAANAGAMGSKIPYLIITRPQPSYTLRFPEFTGYRSNFDTQLSRCTGFTRCTSVHLYCPGAFKSELDEIERLLRSGVIL